MKGSKPRQFLVASPANESTRQPLIACEEKSAHVRKFLSPPITPYQQQT
jgi:hypothetical protein